MAAAETVADVAHDEQVLALVEKAVADYNEAVEDDKCKVRVLFAWQTTR